MSDFSIIRLIQICLLSLLLLQGTSHAAPQPQLAALVIGNAAYDKNPLTNPRNDAELMSQTLEKLGFRVSSVYDADRSKLFESIRSFTDSLQPGAIALVYYAGHGMQIAGGNYLIPVDMVPTSEQGVMMKAYPLKALMDRLGGAPSAVNIVLLDACRNNPFQPQIAARYRNYDNLGLARTVAPRGTVIAYSTQPGQLAEDGKGKQHSLYTETLVREMTKSGRTIEDTLKQVAETVRKKTFEDQQPWFETSLVDEFYFLPPPGIQMVTKAPPQRTARNTDARGKWGMSLDNVWYLSLNETEWSNLDWEVNQRVARATEDELPLLNKRAESGNVVAMTTLGILYREGTQRTSGQGMDGKIFRMNSSNPKALEWLTQAAEAGFPMAQVELGEMYYEAHGVDRDLNKSRLWLEQAARARYPRARMDLAQVKGVANPTPQNIQDMAVEVFRNIMEVQGQYSNLQNGDSNHPLSLKSK